MKLSTADCGWELSGIVKAQPAMTDGLTDAGTCVMLEKGHSALAGENLGSHEDDAAAMSHVQGHRQINSAVLLSQRHATKYKLKLQSC